MHPLRPMLRQIRVELEPLTMAHPTPLTPAIQAYLEYYGLLFADLDYVHSLGTFQASGFTLVSQVFRPRRPEGTVFMLHGYLDHTGIIAPLIRECLEHDLAVALYDLPGHGLSEGERASIETFRDYVAVFEEFLALVMPSLPHPYHLISHSTGGAISLEYLAQAEMPPFEGIVFLAPLVRHVYWYPAKATYALSKVFGIKTVPRRYSELSSDPAFLEFLSQDPLITERVPTCWVGALYDWEADIRTMSPLTYPVLILQGTHDTVVDGEYNVLFLQQKFPQATIKWIQDGRHQLINERSELKAQVFEAIRQYLKT